MPRARLVAWAWEALPHNQGYTSIWRQRGIFGALTWRLCIWNSISLLMVFLNSSTMPRSLSLSCFSCRQRQVGSGVQRCTGLRPQKEIGSRTDCLSAMLALG